VRRKYGRISSELKQIPDDEPLFLIRGQDILGPSAVDGYAQLLESAALLADEDMSKRLMGQAIEVRNISASMVAWQAEHGSKIPDS
jgi:hypothetical protein